MKKPNNKILAEALEFAARWGFLSQQIFFEFICQMSQAQQYRYWVFLVDQGYFVKSKYSDQVLILSKKGRVEFGDLARPARSRFYIEHDSIVARIFLALEARGLIVDSWLEDELMRNPTTAYAILGMPQIHRVPDLVFDLRTSDDQFVRCALEIERITKSQSRYAKMALAYLNASKIDVVLVGCAQPATEKMVRRAFSTSAHIESKRIPGTFLYEDFESASLASAIRFQGNEMSVERFLEVVTKQPVPKMRNTRESHENSFSRDSALKAVSV